MNDKEKPEPEASKETEQDRIQQVREQIKNSKYFINRTQPGKGIAIIGGGQHRKGVEEQ